MRPQKADKGQRQGGKARLSGAGAFEEYYAGVYGERWPALRAALLGPSPQVGLRLLEAGGFELFDPAPDRPMEALPECVSAPAPPPAPAPAPDPAPGATPYFLDPASVDAALCLRLPEEGEVLDACAAPGGKSLVLASRLPPAARLLANEISADRRRRLLAVLDASLPRPLRARVSVFGADASSLCLRRKACFAAILLDAPCSSERHVLADPAALAEWTPSRPRSLAMRQWALLSSAFLMLAPGASLVYSTCSINPEENDGVVARLLKKHGASLVLDRPSMPGAEETASGAIVLPDRSGGRGPMYVARFRRLAEGPGE